MRRATRRAIANLVLFSCALVLILYINNDGRSDDKAFDWTEIKYKTTAKSLPVAHGRCPGLKHAHHKAALVVARVEADGDPVWLNDLSQKYHLCTYTADAPSNQDDHYLRVPANRGHETMAYLTYLIDNYDDLPAASVFVHGSRWAWHNDSHTYDNLELLLALNINSALALAGYHNLRCDWSAGTCPESALPRGSLDTALNARLDPWNARLVSDTALSSALVQLFGDPADSREWNRRTALGRADKIAAQYCAQFVVARENIMQHPRAEYFALRQWLLDIVPGSAPKDERVAGRVMSYLWHILFLPQQEMWHAFAKIAGTRPWRH